MFDERDSYSADNCSVQRTLDVVGEKWTLLVLREAFYGARRFEQFHERVGCARNLLTERLTTLTAAGVMDRVPYREPGQRERHEYRLTDKGRDLITVVVALMQWGDRWEADAAGPPVEILHRECSQPVEAVLVCARDGETLGARDIRPTPGPGARLAPRVDDGRSRRASAGLGLFRPPEHSESGQRVIDGVGVDPGDKGALLCDGGHCD